MTIASPRPILARATGTGPAPAVLALPRDVSPPDCSRCARQARDQGPDRGAGSGACPYVPDGIMPRGTRPDGPGAKYRDVGVGRFGFTKTLLGTIIASSVGFGIYFAIAGAVFLGIYKVPQYRFEDWQLLAGVLLGWFAAVVVTVLASQ